MQKYLLAVLFLAIGSSAAVMASPYGIGKYNENVPYGGQTQLTITTSGNVTITATPSSSGNLSTSTGTVTVTSTDVVGYKLYLRDGDGNTNLVNGANTIAASSNVVAGALAVNTWGYNIDASANFIGITSSDVLLRNRTGPYTSGDVTTMTYGVNIDFTKKPGNYTDTVVYTAVPQTN